MAIKWKLLLLQVINSIQYECCRKKNHLFCQQLLTVEVHDQECCHLSGCSGKVRGQNVQGTQDPVCVFGGLLLRLQCCHESKHTLLEPTMVDIAAQVIVLFNQSMVNCFRHKFTEQKGINREKWTAEKRENKQKCRMAKRHNLSADQYYNCPTEN